MADINEKVNVDTAGAQDDLGDLRTASQKADEWLDNVIDTAREADQEAVSVPVETPGAKDAAEDLGKVDEKARAVEGGAKIGAQGVADMAGPFSDAAGQAGELGQAMDGAAGFAESMAGKLGLSESATGKLTTALGIAGVAVAGATVLWDIYNTSQKNAAKGADEVRDALGDVYAKLKEGDQQAAAQTFVDTMSDKIKAFRDFIGGSVSSEDIAGVIFGDPASIDRVNAAVQQLDGASRVMAEGSVKLLQHSWDDAKAAQEDQIALTDKVASFFGTTATSADGATRSIDETTRAINDNVAATAAATGAPFTPSLQFANGDIGPSSTTLTTVNIFPPANTPLAVEQAQNDRNRIQGHRGAQ